MICHRTHSVVSPLGDPARNGAVVRRCVFSIIAHTLTLKIFNNYFPGQLETGNSSETCRKIFTMQLLQILY